jgi:hypothetical protein
MSMSPVKLYYLFISWKGKILGLFWVNLPSQIGIFHSCLSFSFLVVLGFELRAFPLLA